MNKKTCLVYLLLGSFSCVLFTGFMFYEFGDTIEPWRNFKWQLLGIGLVVGGIAEHYSVIPELISQTGFKYFLFQSPELRPILNRCLIIVGIVIFVCSWL